MAESREEYLKRMNSTRAPAAKPAAPLTASQYWANKAANKGAKKDASKRASMAKPSFQGTPCDQCGSTSWRNVFDYSRKGTLGGAVIGGAIAGPLGALFGAAAGTGKPKKISKVVCQGCGAERKPAGG